MTQTLRRELRIKFEGIIDGKLLHNSDLSDLCERLADAALEVAGIQKRELPPDWLLAAGVPAAEVAAANDKIQVQKAKSDAWERLMGYGALDWGSADMEFLLRFLMDKSDAEMETFAEWSRAKYSSFTPVKARLHPRKVKEMWNLAFLGEEPEDPRMKFYTAADLD